MNLTLVALASILCAGKTVNESTCIREIKKLKRRMIQV